MRQLRVEVEIAGTEQAVRDLGRVDQAIDGLSDAARKSDKAFADFKKQVTDNAAASRAQAEASRKAADGSVAHADATKHVSAAMSVANKAFGILAGYQIASTLKNMALASVRLAGDITDLANQSGVSASALLRMTNAAELSGVSASGLADQITKLTDALVSGDKSAVAGVKALGLNLGDLLRMSADDRYMAIVSRLGDVGVGARQTGIAFDIFKKQAKEALKLANDGFAENAAKASTWSEAQMRTLDRMGDAWTTFKQNVTSALGSIMAFMSDLQTWQQTAQWWSPANIMADMPTGPGAPNTLPSFRVGEIPFASGTPSFVTRDLDAAEAMTKIMEDAGKEARKAGEEFAKLQATMLDQRGWDAHVAKLQAEARAMMELAAMAGAASQGLDSVARSRQNYWGAQALEGLPAVTEGWPTGIGERVSTPGIGGANVPFWNVPSNGPSVKSFSDLYGWNRLKGVLPAQLLQVFSGGNVGMGLGSMAGSIGGTMLGGVASSLATAGTGLMSGGMTAALGLAGNVLPILGPILGAFLGRKLGSLFGPSKNAQLTQQANAGIAQTQQGLLGQFGSVENIAGMNTAGQELAAGWGHRGVAGQEQFNRLVAEFQRMTQEQNALLDEQATKQQTLLDLEAQRAALAESLVPTWAQVSTLLEKYGISLDAAGKQVQQMATTASFKTIIDDIETMERAGIDVGSMLAGMADEIQKVVDDSIKFGTTIPANMKPYIEELVRAGKLTVDLTQIKWGDAIKSEADIIKDAMAKLDDTISKLGDRLKEIADLLAKMLPAAAAEGAAGVEREFASRNPRLTVDVDYNDPGYTPPGFAGGSGGLRDFGAGTLAVLHGREAVVTEDQWRGLRGGGGGASGVSVSVDARGSFFESEAAMQRFADRTAAAVMMRIRANTPLGAAV